MNWSDVAKKAVSIGLPTLGTALAGGAGAQVGSLIASALGCDPTPESVQSAMTGDNMVALAKIQSDERVTIAAQASTEHLAQISADTTTIQAINATIQADSTGKNWLQQNAQAMCKLAAMASVILIYFALPLFGQPVPSVPESAWLMMGCILGIKSWHDGQTQTAKVNAAAAIANAP